MPRPTAAEAIFGHLPHRSDVAQRQDKTTVADAMYPALTQKAQARDMLREQRKQKLRQALQEAAANIERRR